jgi:osmotically-inducible protein OsmY
MVDDLSLEFAVSRSLLQAGIGHNAIIHPRARLGETTLYGHTDSTGSAEEAVRAASRVPGVRSVSNRLDIPQRQASSA